MSRVPRAAAAVAGLVAGNVLAGRLITGPLRGLPAEHRLNHDLRRHAGRRTQRLAQAVSRSSDTARAIGTGAGLTAVLLAIGRRRPAAVPGVAMALAATTHVVSSTLVGRPRPALERLGTPQPTSSFPSGHVGAMTALAVAATGIGRELPRPARAALGAALAGYLGLLGWSRLYNGQHYASDVIAGYVNGTVCGALALHLLAPGGRDRPAGDTPRR